MTSFLLDTFLLGDLSYGAIAVLILVWLRCSLLYLSTLIVSLHDKQMASLGGCIPVHQAIVHEKVFFCAFVS